MRKPLAHDPLVAIAIATFRRPQHLLRLLKSLEVQECAFRPHIVVAENDSRSAEGSEIVRTVLQNGFRLPLTTIIVPERGISHARNALLDHCFRVLRADAVAMIDDDERADPQWIGELVRVWDRTGADIVGGPTLPEFEFEVPAWARGQSVYWREMFPEGIVDIVRATGNVLISGSVDRKWGVRFDESFALSGGEDHEFFFRLKYLGARFAYAPTAQTHEWIGADRMRPGWAIRRAYRIGNTDFRILLVHGLAPRAWIDEGLKLSAALLLAPLQILVYGWHSSRRVRALLMLARQAGKISALFGQRPYHYGNQRRR